jgi:hypothetical protein
VKFSSFKGISLEFKVIVLEDPGTDGKFQELTTYWGLWRRTL